MGCPTRRSRSRTCAATATITLPTSSRPRSKARPGSSSIRWFTRRCAGGWATNCMRWRCRRARRKINPQGKIIMTTNATVFDRIKQDISDNTVVLFMKGTPVFPQCGFSAAVVQILTHLGVKFKGIDVLADPEIRQGIKEFSSWPTIPQLYVKGEFVGGCDIIREMFESGELGEFLKGKGVDIRS